MKELTSDYITCSMIGRLGNQLFQIAHAYSQSLTHNRQFVAPKYDTSVSPYFNNIFRHIDFLIDNTRDLKDAERIQGSFLYSPLSPVKDKITVFHGFYQSEKFFRENSQKIKELFSPTSDFIEKCYLKYPELRSNNVTAINVRRGDYLTKPTEHPVVTKEYIQKALEYIPDPKIIFVVSDDTPWCMENIKGDNITYVDYVTWEALWLLSLCKNFVLSNSTFSWWGAFLGESSNSIVITPSVWFGPEVHRRGHYETDIYKENWLKIDTYFDNGEIKVK